MDMTNRRNRPETGADEGGTLSGLSVSAVVAVRMNFAVQHLLAAAHFAQLAHQAEEANAGKKFGPFFEEVLWVVSACVFSSVAGVESYANETFVDRETTFPDIQGDLADKIWQLCERDWAIEKFDVVCRLRGAGVLDRGSHRAQDLAALVALRNGLTHFKPQWDTETAAHAKISRLLEGKFEPSSVILGEPIFPRCWACYSCARWAVDASRDFLLMIETTAGLPQKVGKHKGRIRG